MYPYITPHTSQVLRTSCGQSSVERQLIMSTSTQRKASPTSDSITPEELKQAPPEPRSSKSPQINMLILFRGRKDIPARVLHNSGCATPIASEKWIEEHNVPFLTHPEQKEIQNFAGDTVEDCRWCYSFPITCQHGDHYSKETFEIGLMEDSGNLMLSYW